MGTAFRSTCLFEKALFIQNSSCMINLPGHKTYTFDVASLLYTIQSRNMLPVLFPTRRINVLSDFSEIPRTIYSQNFEDISGGQYSQLVFKDFQMSQTTFSKKKKKKNAN